MDILNRHVTIRRFAKKPVSDELLKAVIFSGTRASTTGNMQLYSIIVNKQESIREKLMPLHFNQVPAATAPVLLTFVADFNRFSSWCRLRKAVPGYNNLLSFLNAMTDALLVSQNVCIAAENAGLGICYLGTTLYNAGPVIDLLRLPPLTFPVTTVAIGWPDEQPDLTDRIPLSGIIHEEYYRTYSPETILDLYKSKEELASSLTFIAENLKETLAQVFTDVRYKKSDNEYYSGKLTEALKRQGFLE